RSAAVELPSRHLGLVQAEELADLDARLDAAADAIGATAWACMPEPVSFAASEVPRMAPLLQGVRSRVGRYTRCASLQMASLELVRALGAEVCFLPALVGDRCPAV